MARISLHNMATLFRRVGVSLQAGVDILRVWETESGRGSAAHQAQLATIHQRLKRGDSLNESLAACNGYFPVMAIEMVKVGELAGKLDTVLLRLADHYEHLIRLRRDFINGIAWPVTQLVLAILVITLLIFVMGILNTADILGFGLSGASGAVVFLLIVGLIGGAIAAVVYSLAKGWWGPAPILTAMKLPVIGPFLENTAMTRFCWSLAVAVDAGMDVRDCMRMALRSTHNPAYTLQHAKADSVLAQGGEFHEAVQATGVFPKELFEAVLTADHTGTHTETLLHMAKVYEDRSKDNARTLAYVASGGVWLVVASFLIFMIIRLAMFYLGTINDALKMTQ